jgi:hypothetical protein
MLWPASEFYVPPLEVLRLEGSWTAFGHFSVVHHESGMRADIYVTGSDELQRWALEHRKVVSIEGERMQPAPIEYVIANKLRYARDGGADRHLRDVVRMLQLNQANIDLPTLDRWLAHRGVRGEWELVIAGKGTDE